MALPVRAKFTVTRTLPGRVWFESPNHGRLELPVTNKDVADRFKEGARFDVYFWPEPPPEVEEAAPPTVPTDEAPMRAVG